MSPTIVVHLDTTAEEALAVVDAINAMLGLTTIEHVVLLGE